MWGLLCTRSMLGPYVFAELVCYFCICVGHVSQCSSGVFNWEVVERVVALRAQPFPVAWYVRASWICSEVAHVLCCNEMKSIISLGVPWQLCVSVVAMSFWSQQFCCATDQWRCQLGVWRASKGVFGFAAFLRRWSLCALSSNLVQLAVHCTSLLDRHDCWCYVSALF